MNHLISVIRLTACLLLLSKAVLAAPLTNQTINITLPELTVTLPAVSEVLAPREAKPTPEEFALAQELRPLLDSGSYADALRKLDQQKALSPALLLVKAQLLTQENKFDDALLAYDDVLKEMSQLVRAHQGKAIILLIQKRYKLAQTALTNAIRYGLHDADAYTQLAYINLQVNDAWSAIGAFQQALMLDPDNASLRFGLLSALIKTKQTNSAINLIESLLDTEPNNADLWLQRANMALSIEDTDMALASLETAIRLGDNQSSNYVIAAQLHLQAGNISRAQTLLLSNITLEQEQVTALFPLLAQQSQWSLLDKLMSRYKPALEQLTGIKKSRYHLYQAQLAQQNNNRNAEKNALTNALKADPSNGQAMMSLANIHREAQNFTAAEQYYTQATTLESMKRDAYLGLAQTFLDQQQYSAALDNLVELAKLEPHNKEIQQNIASIKRILLARQ